MLGSLLRTASLCCLGLLLLSFTFHSIPSEREADRRFEEEKRAQDLFTIPAALVPLVDAIRSGDRLQIHAAHARLRQENPEELESWITDTLLPGKITRPELLGLLGEHLTTDQPTPNVKMVRIGSSSNWNDNWSLTVYFNAETEVLVNWAYDPKYRIIGCD